MFVFVDPPSRLGTFNHLRYTLPSLESSTDGPSGWYETGFGSWRAAYDNLGWQLREHGNLRGAIRVFFQQTSGLGYVLSQYPRGGWEFVDYLVRHQQRGSLDRIFVENSWAWGIRYRAQIVQDLLAQFIGEQRVQEKDTAVLDLGCGPGHLALHAAELGGQRVVGVDYDPRAIRIAGSRAEEQGLADQVHFKHQDAFQYLASVQEDFDLVLLLGLVAYLGDDEALELLGRIRRHLRAGGWLVTNNTSAQTSHLFLRWARLMGLKGLRTRSAVELRTLLANAGYQRIELITDRSGTQHIAVGKVAAMFPSATSVPLVEFVPITELLDHEEVEPQRVESLAREIQKSKRVVPLLVEKTHHVVLDGHHRKEALKLLGFRRIPCLRVDYASVQLGSWRPDLSLTKEEVVQRALRGEKFPPKTTRHVHDFELTEVEVSL